MSSYLLETLTLLWGFTRLTISVVLSFGIFVVFPIWGSVKFVRICKEGWRS